MPESIRKLSRRLSASVIDRLPLIIVAFATLMLVTLSYIAVDTSAKMVRESLTSQGLAAASIVRSKLDSELSSHAELIKSEATSPIVRNALADSEGLQSYLRPHLNSLILGYEAILSIALMDSAGTTVVSAEKPGLAAERNAGFGREQLLDKTKKGRPAYSLTDGSLLTLAWPVWFPPTGQYEGILLARIDLAMIVKKLVAQIPNDPDQARVTIRFFAHLEKPEPRAPGSGTYIPGKEFVLSQLVPLADPFESHLAEIEYRQASNQERNAVIRNIWAHTSSTIIAWLIFLILTKWIKARYVEPIKRITAIASSFAQNINDTGLAAENNPVEKLQNSVQGVIEVLNNTEHSYQEKIRFTALELSQTRARLDEIARSGNIIALSVDLQTGCIDYATDSLAKIINSQALPAHRQPSNWKTAYRLASKNDRSKLNQGIRTCLRSGFARLPVELRMNNQNFIFDVRLQKTPPLAGGANRIDCIALDNTEVAAKELALIQSEHRKSAIINAALDGFITLTRDFVVTEVNPAAEHLLGRKNIILLGLRFIDHCIAPASVNGFTTFCDQLMASKAGSLTYQGEPVWCKNIRGKNIPVDLSGSLITTPSGLQICLYVKDLRKTHVQQQEIAGKTAEVQAILDLSPGGFASFNEEGRLSAHNEALREMLALDPERCASHVNRYAFEQLLKQMTITNPSKNLKKLISSDERILQLDNAKKKLLKYAKRYPKSTDGNKSKACVYYFTDITQEFQLDTLKSNFMATAAHELRTPLTTILGFSEILSTQNLPAAERTELVRSIFKHSIHLSALISDLLDLSRIESNDANIYKPSHTDLKKILHDLIDKSSTRRDEKRFIQDHEIVLDVEADNSLAVMADEEKLSRAIQNILSNATKYSAPESPIKIDAKRIQKNGLSWVKVTVIDQGIGMTKEEAEHAFVRFWRADSHSGKIPGTGLGLSLVKEIIELHGGHVEIESEYGVGTTVTLFIPFITDNAGANQ